MVSGNQTIEKESMKKVTMNGTMELVERRIRMRTIGRVKPVIGRRK